MKICSGYCGLTCVDGSCPKANIDEYAERGYDIVHSCNECPYYLGCEDCYFENTEACVNMDMGGCENCTINYTK